MSVTTCSIAHGFHIRFPFTALPTDTTLDNTRPCMIVLVIRLLIKICADVTQARSMAFPSSVDELGFPCEGGTDTVDFDGSEAPLTGRRKKMAKKPKSGGFESLELLPEIYRALKLKGYQLPTPVQRKTLPLALAGARSSISSTPGLGSVQI